MKALREYTHTHTGDLNKGITLVALVVTIIILLILAGISISQLTGSGLFEKAKLSKEKSIKAEMEEELTLAMQELQLEKSGKATINDVTEEFFGKTIQNEKFEVTLYESENDKIVTIKKGDITGNYMINENLNILEAEENTKKEKLINLSSAVYSGDLSYLEILEDRITINYFSSGWGAVDVYMDNMNLIEYDQIKFTYSFEAGYDWGIALLDPDDNSNHYFVGSNVLVGHHGSVEKTTNTFDIPKDKEYTSLVFESSSLNAKLHIYDITLIKY